MFPGYRTALGLRHSLVWKGRGSDVIVIYRLLLITHNISQMCNMGSFSTFRHLVRKEKFKDAEVPNAKVPHLAHFLLLHSRVLDLM